MRVRRNRHGPLSGCRCGRQNVGSAATGNQTGPSQRQTNMTDTLTGTADTKARATRQAMFAMSSSCLKCDKAFDPFAASGSPDGMHVDHVVPGSKGGPDHLSNYQPLCGRCNTAKGNRSSADYRSAEQKAMYPVPAEILRRREQAEREARAERDREVAMSWRLTTHRPPNKKKPVEVAAHQTASKERREAAAAGRPPCSAAAAPGRPPSKEKRAAAAAVSPVHWSKMLTAEAKPKRRTSKPYRPAFWGGKPI